MSATPARTLLFLPRYGRVAASSRMRFYSVEDAARQRGRSTRVLPLFGDAYLANRFTSRSRAGLLAAQGLLRRVGASFTARKAAVLYIHFEFLAMAPYPVERLAMPRQVPYVLDFDDAWFHRYDGIRNPIGRTLLVNKFPRLIEAAAGVVVGSHYLETYVRQFNDNVLLAPTSIDISNYPSRQPTSDSAFTVGWIGSPSTTDYLSCVASTVHEFVHRVGGRFVLVGAGNNAPSGERIVRKAWHERTEVTDIAKFDVGIMPLPNTPFAKGKCAFKLVQYMGCWKPVIASPVGENNHVVDDGRTGFLASSPTEWQKALETLHRGPSLRSEMGNRGRALVEQQYSLQVNADRVVDFLENSALKQPR